MDQGRRIGTFLVFLDDMVVPLIAFPINLSLGLNLPEAEAYVVRVLFLLKSYVDGVRWGWGELHHRHMVAQSLRVPTARVPELPSLGVYCHYRADMAEARHPAVDMV